MITLVDSKQFKMLGVKISGKMEGLLTVQNAFWLSLCLIFIT